MGKVTKAVGVAGAVAGAVYLSKGENRQKVKRQLAKIQGKEDSSYLKNLGKPSDIEDANMVNEGAMTSVQYYNRLQDEKTESK
ncbi:hypothetical protein HUG20_13000 [Salicibibacter cibi]|uniref:YtxH domain-containing protein n=1 Tax=Salicibibacter cibi TaxID=2743001 RepID=A0A7T6ZC94_9BACI|nr:hypothetical protein [Salicibibacter cibi]QQK80722.1 hypothetical protein HUG20_13000 [Salicibibacter cibi]